MSDSCLLNGVSWSNAGVQFGLSLECTVRIRGRVAQALDRRSAVFSGGQIAQGVLRIVHGSGAWFREVDDTYEA